MRNQKNLFTWADLKQAVNEMPEQELKRLVYLWSEDTGHRVTDILILEEDYVSDGDEGCMPRSEWEKLSPEDRPEEELSYAKNTRILYSRPLPDDFTGQTYEPADDESE